MKHIIKKIFSKKAEKAELTFEGFNKEQKQEIVKLAVTTSSQVCMSAIVLCEAENFITGDTIFPDGTKWRLTFEKLPTNK